MSQIYSWVKKSWFNELQVLLSEEICTQLSCSSFLKLVNIHTDTHENNMQCVMLGSSRGMRVLLCLSPITPNLLDVVNAACNDSLCFSSNYVNHAAHASSHFGFLCS